jgi:hypothetical protein
MSPRITMASGQSCFASRTGIAECTPNLLVSHEQLATTLRSELPPMITGFPWRALFLSLSTETKKESRSMCTMLREGAWSIETELSGRW